MSHQLQRAVVMVEMLVEPDADAVLARLWRGSILKPT
jgi:hypothetical protein